ncbi:MAG: bile acid:sodium symporter, partial [Planctomycetes bacterium]|nr:bile acid:sodium symporter [Planctomycetota bacterium]
MKYVIRNWFLIAIALVLVAAFFVPEAYLYLKRWKVLKIVLAVVFLTTGLTLDTRLILTEIRNFKALAAALVSSFVIFPAVAFALAKVFWSGPSQASQDLLVGVCILGVAPATVASGTILSRLAKGSVPLSVFICVATNILGIFTIPPALKLMVGISQDIDLPIVKMFAGLVTIVLAPMIVGQLLRIRLKGVIGPYRKYFSLYSKLTVLTENDCQHGKFGIQGKVFAVWADYAFESNPQKLTHDHRRQ